jgi:hypothetical protein
LESAASLEARQARLIDSGTSVYLFESHPRFAPPEPTWAVPDWVAPRSLGEWEVVQAQPDFTLHELRGPKVR